MKYILMHKNTAAAEIKINNETADVTHIYDVISKEHLPVGTYKDNIDRGTLNRWLAARSIPKGRYGMQDVLFKLKLHDPLPLILRCFGLSLSDQYWLKPSGSALEWNEVNFFDNPFSEDMGKLLFGGARVRPFNFVSPDSTCDGTLIKRWEIIGGKRCLIKGGSDPYRQQTFNEVIASRLMDRLNIPHVSYSLIWRNGKPYSVCEDFITRDTELISAWNMMQLRDKDSEDSYYRQYTDICKGFGIEDIECALDMMIALDFIIANTDRHYGNFGLIRNADTLEWLGAAPIYDSGTSLNYSIATHRFFDVPPKCKPFAPSREEQLKLVTSFDWIDFKALDGFEDEAYDILSKDNVLWSSGEEERAEKICTFIRQRINLLEQEANSRA